LLSRSKGYDREQYRSACSLSFFIEHDVSPATLRFKLCTDTLGR
jgi:hypothetical protein